ncbi:MAG: radical SAM protein [Nitrospinae bacterium]|nr:radical SAM protein [Nitrospinota bacterium]
MGNEYRQAPWLITEKDPARKDHFLVHNNLTGRTFRLQKKLAGQPIGKGVDGRWLNFLVAEKLVVKQEDIEPTLDEYLRYCMYGHPTNESQVVFLPTYSCQFACTYCYNDQVRAQNMEKKRLAPEKIAKKMADHLESSPGQTWKLLVTGGGEPFLVADYLYKIASLLKSAARKNGREFTFQIITNGQAATRDKVEKLMKAGLAGLQITIDPEHDKTRPMKGGKPSLSQVLANIKALPPQIRLTLTTNIHAGEEEEYRKMLKMLLPLRERFASTSVTPIMDRVPTLSPEEEGKISRLNTKKTLATLVKCFDAIDELGYMRKLAFPRIVCEAFIMCEELMMNFAGETTFCAALDSLPQYRCDAKSEEAKDKFELRIANQGWKQHCFKEGEPCAFAPSCWGGCRMISVTQGKNWDTINCEKPMFDEMARYELRRWAEVWSM